MPLDRHRRGAAGARRGGVHAAPAGRRRGPGPVPPDLRDVRVRPGVHGRVDAAVRRARRRGAACARTSPTSPPGACARSGSPPATSAATSRPIRRPARERLRRRRRVARLVLGVGAAAGVDRLRPDERPPPDAPPRDGRVGPRLRRRRPGPRRRHRPGRRPDAGRRGRRRARADRRAARLQVGRTAGTADRSESDDPVDPRRPMPDGSRLRRDCDFRRIVQRTGGARCNMSDVRRASSRSRSSPSRRRRARSSSTSACSCRCCRRSSRTSSAPASSASG